jgi:hypothetical protein
VGVNASGPGVSDGFEYVADFVNDNNLGQAQMILNHAGLTPNGVLESDSASQIKEALQKGWGGMPGKVNQWHLASDPGVTGHRCLLLNGQGILRANYTELDAAVYVGDANNAAVAAAGGGYYRADDAAGTSPNIAGIYLILPETRGYIPRGLDAAGTVDPQGASRYLGDIQLDAFQGHEHEFYYIEDVVAGGTNASDTTSSVSTQVTDGIVTDGVNGTPRITSETRMTNFATKYVIWY